MKAIVYYDYGSPDVLRFEEIPKPTPGDGEVLLKVRAASVNPLDWRLMRGKPYLVRMIGGLSRPLRPGRDVAGEVEAVGKNVTQFKSGDEVFGVGRGTFAEFACAPESGLVVKPASVTFEQAASVPIAGLTALQGLRDKGRIQRGQTVLINGAAGGVGTFAVQFARSFGAEVTGVCSTRNVDMVRSIGADRVVDYTREDFTRSGQRYDLLLECVGNQSLAAARSVLTPNGICVIAGAPKEFGVILARGLKAMVVSRLGGQRFALFVSKMSKPDLTTIGEFIATGKVTPVIERCYRLSEVPEAIRYSEEGHARGKLVVTLDPEHERNVSSGQRP
jgi:NADPH:quinone reductase-like Zn-dependent oxidoreductase